MPNLRMRPAGTSSPGSIAEQDGDDVVTLLSINVGLVRVAIAGFTVFQPAPFILERLAALPKALMASGANVVALQEVFRATHRKQIVAATRDAFPHAAWAESPIFGLSSGLLVLSDRPLMNPQQLRYSRHPFDERFYAQKGLLVAAINAGPSGPIRIINLHTTAGGKYLDYNAPKTIQLRSSQLAEAMEAAATPADGPTLLVGDFNTGLGAAETNYLELIDAGYVDLVKEANAGTPERELCTWDPEQPLANGKGDEKGEPRRLDHVFVAEKEKPLLKAEEARIVFRDPVVPIPVGQMVPLSDHYGVSIRIRRT